MGDTEDDRPRVQPEDNAMLDAEDDDEVADTEEEVEVNKSGILEYGKPADKKRNALWFILLGSTLYGYKTSTHVEPKTTIQLAGTKIEETDKQAKAAFLIKDGEDKELYVFIAGSGTDRAEWVTKLSAATAAAPQPPPEKSRSKKGTLTFRFKKSLGSKVASTSTGQKLAKNIVPTHIRDLIASLRNVLQEIEGATTAAIVEDNVMRLSVKCFFLEENKTLRIKDFIIIDRPIRAAFKKMISIRDTTMTSRGLSQAGIDAACQEIGVNMREAEQLLTNLLMPHLKPKTVQRIAVIFAVLADVDFLKRVFVYPEEGTQPMEEDIDNLCAVIDRYCCVEVYEETFDD
eukprot:Lithocolla_globosa_v1_NODE_5730_length_1194_cov_24.330992.p1 type:complete len:345 gc:universal NODE_5730_length_1194_cov_24.330992:1121-87(-)